MGMKNYSLDELQAVIATSNLDELRLLSLTIRENSELYDKKDLAEIMVMISNKLIELCSS